MTSTRLAGVHSMLLIAVSLLVTPLIAEERQSSTSESAISGTSSGRPMLKNRLFFDFAGFSIGDISTPLELPRHSRVSRSRRPLRQITLVDGDRFVAECLDWESDAATFRLLTGQTVRLPTTAVAVFENPLGEADLINESFEVDSFVEPGSNITEMLDDQEAADGRRSLKIDSSSSGYQLDFTQPLNALRIEFSFKTIAGDLSTFGGEWRIECDGNLGHQSLAHVRIEAGRRISVVNVPVRKNAEFQSLTLSDGWHSFIAIISADQTRLMIDEAILASFATPENSIRAIRFLPAPAKSKNVLWIDELQVRSMDQIAESDRLTDTTTNSDLIRLANGDEVFGRVIGLTRQAATIESFGQRQVLPWNRLSGIAWRHLSSPIQQAGRPASGIIARIELQPFVDRPACEPEHWTATVVRVDAERLIANHSDVGELVIPWSDIRRIIPQFFGQTLLVDGRRIHLGNSIRSDFHRHLPEGTDFSVEFRLHEIPQGRCHVSLDIADVEAAGPTAPPGSPFLAELRAGRLITDVFVNDHLIGNLNSLIRFKAKGRNPDRIRLAFSRDLLKLGENSFRFRQQPLTENGREFDDCEVGDLRLEFDQTN